MKELILPDGTTAGGTSVYLSGVTSTTTWQKFTINCLNYCGDTSDLVLLEPLSCRGIGRWSFSDFTREQEWCFSHAEGADIFSLYLSSESSALPLYYLGRYFTLFQRRFPEDYNRRFIVSLEDGYCWYDELIVQLHLALQGEHATKDIICEHATPQKHAHAIFDAYNYARLG